MWLEVTHLRGKGAATFAFCKFQALVATFRGAALEHPQDEWQNDGVWGKVKRDEIKLARWMNTMSLITASGIPDGVTVKMMMEFLVVVVVVGDSVSVVK